MGRTEIIIVNRSLLLKLVRSLCLTCLFVLLVVQLGSAQVIEQEFDGISFVRIEGGDFIMGSETSQPFRLVNEKRQALTIPHSFWISKYEISQAKWIEVMGVNPSQFKALGPAMLAPVESISWDQAKTFIAQLNAISGQERYRLPTEAEWEYVAKGGEDSSWPFGDRLSLLADYTDRQAGPAPSMSGLKSPNPFGVYDLYGNVYEWVEDWYRPSRDRSLYSCPPAEGIYKVIRGGCNGCMARWQRATSRNFARPDRKNYAIGLRLVRVDDPEHDPFRVSDSCVPTRRCADGSLSIEGQCPPQEPPQDGEGLPGLGIVEYDADLPAYDRSDWPHWKDIDGDCIDTRHEVLSEESSSPVSMKVDDECRVASGEWADPYTGLDFTDPSALDVDHMVPLANAHLSGGWQWSREEREAYANDLSDAEHLIAVQAAANRSKGARGPEEWRPPNEDYHCEYAQIWINIKARWGLSATAAEWLALLEMLDTCPGGRPPIIDAPVVDALPIDGPSHPGDIVNCGDFIHYQEALAWFLQYAGDFGDIARLDHNGDLIPCTSLPGAP